MTRPSAKVALNPIQYFATPDAWVDPSVAPPLEERLKVIADAGFTAVQTEDALDDAAYVALLAEYGIKTGPGYWGARLYGQGAEQDLEIDSARRSAARHAAMGVDLIFFATGMSRDAARVKHAAVGAEPDQARLEAIARHIDRAAKAMAEEGVIAALHPHVGTTVETEAETRWVLENTDPSTLRFGPDVGHLGWAGADYLGLIAQYKSRIPGVHIKDFNADVAAAGRAERLAYQETVLRGLWTEPGYGSCDLDAVFAALGADANPWVVIEVDFPMAPTPAESIARCGEWAKRFFAN